MESLSYKNTILQKQRHVLSCINIILQNIVASRCHVSWQQNLSYLAKCQYHGEEIKSTQNIENKNKTSLGKNKLKNTRKTSEGRKEAISTKVTL